MGRTKKVFTFLERETLVVVFGIVRELGLGDNVLSLKTSDPEPEGYEEGVEWTATSDVRLAGGYRIKIGWERYRSHFGRHSYVASLMIRSPEGERTVSSTEELITLGAAWGLHPRPACVQVREDGSLRPMPQE